MPETLTMQTATTSNGSEILSPRDVLGYDEFKGMLDIYGFDGPNAAERVSNLKGQTKESLAVFLTDLNSRLNGSEDSLVHEETMKIGNTPTVEPESRYELFSEIFMKIQSASPDINPARVGDTLALATVLLHPFKDGNGRTARMIGYMFRDNFDSLEATEDFNVVTEPRDNARERGGFMINGYTPWLGEGTDQSDPEQVLLYVDKLLSSDDPNLYTSPFGQAELAFDISGV